MFGLRKLISLCDNSATVIVTIPTAIVAGIAGWATTSNHVNIISYSWFAALVLLSIGAFSAAVQLNRYVLAITAVLGIVFSFGPEMGDLGLNYFAAFLTVGLGSVLLIIVTLLAEHNDQISLDESPSERFCPVFRCTTLFVVLPSVGIMYFGSWHWLLSTCVGVGLVLLAWFIDDLVEPAKQHGHAPAAI